MENAQPLLNAIVAHPFHGSLAQIVNATHAAQNTTQAVNAYGKTGKLHAVRVINPLKRIEVQSLDSPHGAKDRAPLMRLAAYKGANGSKSDNAEEQISNEHEKDIPKIRLAKDGDSFGPYCYHATNQAGFRRQQMGLVLIWQASGGAQTSMMEEQTEKIMTRMFKNRIPQDKETYASWNHVSVHSIRPIKPREFIVNLLREGKQVTAGFFTTGVRGFHEYFLFWK